MSCMRKEKNVSNDEPVMMPKKCGTYETDLKEGEEKEINADEQSEEICTFDNFQLDDDIKSFINIYKINCTCESARKKFNEYNGTKYEYYYNITTYGNDFFLDICNALSRSNYKLFLSEEGKQELIRGLRLRRNSNLYKYVSFFLCKERLNKDRITDGKKPEVISHCFRCLRSVLHIYIDNNNSHCQNKFLYKHKYITAEMERQREAALLNDVLKEKTNFRNGAVKNEVEDAKLNGTFEHTFNDTLSDIMEEKLNESLDTLNEIKNSKKKEKREKREKREKKRNSPLKKGPLKKGVISVGKYKSELESLTNKYNEKIMKEMMEHAESLKMEKELDLVHNNMLNRSCTSDGFYNYYENVMNRDKEDWEDAFGDLNMETMDLRSGPVKTTELLDGGSCERPFKATDRVDTFSNGVRDGLIDGVRDYVRDDTGDGTSEEEAQVEAEVKKEITGGFKEIRNLSEEWKEKPGAEETNESNEVNAAQETHVEKDVLICSNNRYNVSNRNEKMESNSITTKASTNSTYKDCLSSNEYKAFSKGNDSGHKHARRHDRVRGNNKVKNLMEEDNTSTHYVHTVAKEISTKDNLSGRSGEVTLNEKGVAEEDSATTSKRNNENIEEPNTYTAVNREDYTEPRRSLRNMYNASTKLYMDKLLEHLRGNNSALVPENIEMKVDPLKMNEKKEMKWKNERRKTEKEMIKEKEHQEKEKKKKKEKEKEKQLNLEEEEEEEEEDEDEDEEEENDNITNESSSGGYHSSYETYMERKRQLQEEGKIVIDLDDWNRNAVPESLKITKAEKLEQRQRMKEIEKIVKKKKMVFCTAQDIARRRNKKYARMQILSEDAKVERSYFCYQIKKFYNHKSGYFGCGWSKNKTEWTPFIHAPYFERNSVAILKTKDKKLYEDIYDTVVHGKVHPDIRVVELKDHTHPIRLSTPADEDCFSVIYVGKKINAEDERVIFGEYTGYVASNREMSQETHQYTFALTFNKKVFNEKSNVLFVNEVPSDEEQGNDTHEREDEEGQEQGKGKKKHRQERGRTEDEETAEEEVEYRAYKKGENETKSEEKGCSLEISSTSKERRGRKTLNEEKTKQNDLHTKRIILPDDYTYAVDSSIMFNEMSLVNHYKTCDLFYEHDFRINSEWQLVYIDGWPHIILTSIPGIEVFPGEELFADFGFEWFEKVNEICLSNFVKDLYEHRLNKLKMKHGKEEEIDEENDEEEDNNIKGLSDVVEKYELLKCSTTCNICMYSISMNGYDNVVCSGCNNTYHLECVHKTFNDLNSNYEWFCPFCIQFTLKVTESREYQAFAQRERQRKIGTKHVYNSVCMSNSNGSSNNSSIGSSYASGSTFADRLCLDKWCQGDLKGMFRGTKSVDELLKIQCVIDELKRCKREVSSIIKDRATELKMLFVEEPINIKEFPKGEVFMLQDKGEVQIEPLQFNALSGKLQGRDLKCILANYTNRVDEFLLKKEKLYCLLNSEVTRKRLKVSKHKLKLLMQSKSDVEDFLKEENQFKEMLELNEKCENLLNMENKEQMKQLFQEDIITGNNTPSGKSEKSEVGQSEILSFTPGSNSFENILHNKYNYVYEKLKEMRTEDKKCFKNAMKLSKRYIGFPLLTEFESGLSTKEPSLPLSDNLKNLRVCSNCYKAHKDIAQAIICRITKMHFQPNFDECASDGNLFKASSECVQLVIRELANTLRAYRKKELCGIFPPKENARVHAMETTNSAEENQMGAPNNAVNQNASIFSVCDESGKDDKLQEQQKKRNREKNSSSRPHIRNVEYAEEQKSSERGESSSMKQKEGTKFEKQKDVKTNNMTTSAYGLKGKYDSLKRGDDEKSGDENSSDNSDDDSQKRTRKLFVNNNTSDIDDDENDDKKGSETNEDNGVDKKKKNGQCGNESIGKTESKSNFIPLIGVELGKTKFQREFTDGVYVGTVTEQIKDEYGDTYFVVTYEDGDAEWITPSFLFRELLKQSTNDVEYPLSTQFKELFHHNFQNDAELKNYSIELKLEKKKKKCTETTSKNKGLAQNDRNNSNAKKHTSVTRGVSSKRKRGTYETSSSKKSSSVGNLKNADENNPETFRGETNGRKGSKRRKTTNIM